MERLTTRKCGELLIKYKDGEYRSPCLGCESINKCYTKKVACDFYKALEKLEEYEDLEEQRKLMKLPCAAGDTVWCLQVHSGGGRVHDWGEIFQSKFATGMYDDFGKTVFLTKEEVKAALKQMEEKKV